MYSLCLTTWSSIGFLEIFSFSISFLIRREVVSPSSFSDFSEFVYFSGIRVPQLASIFFGSIRRLLNQSKFILGSSKFLKTVSLLSRASIFSRTLSSSSSHMTFSLSTWSSFFFRQQTYTIWQMRNPRAIRTTRSINRIFTKHSRKAFYPTSLQLLQLKWTSTLMDRQLSSTIKLMTLLMFSLLQRQGRQMTTKSRRPPAGIKGAHTCGKRTSNSAVETMAGAYMKQKFMARGSLRKEYRKQSKGSGSKYRRTKATKLRRMVMARMARLITSVYWELYLKKSPEQNTKQARLNIPMYINNCNEISLAFIAQVSLQFSALAWSASNYSDLLNASALMVRHLITRRRIKKQRKGTSWRAKNMLKLFDSMYLSKLNCFKWGGPLNYEGVYPVCKSRAELGDGNKLRWSPVEQISMVAELKGLSKYDSTRTKVRTPSWHTIMAQSPTSRLIPIPNKTLRMPTPAIAQLRQKVVLALIRDKEEQWNSLVVKFAEEFRVAKYLSSTEGSGMNSNIIYLSRKFYEKSTFSTSQLLGYQKVAAVMVKIGSVSLKASFKFELLNTQSGGHMLTFIVKVLAKGSRTIEIIYIIVSFWYEQTETKLILLQTKPYSTSQLSVQPSQGFPV